VRDRRRRRRARRGDPAASRDRRRRRACLVEPLAAAAVRLGDDPARGPCRLARGRPQSTRGGAAPSAVDRRPISLVARRVHQEGVARRRHAAADALALNRPAARAAIVVWLAAVLAIIWWFPFFPTGDGPSHLY